LKDLLGEIIFTHNKEESTAKNAKDFISTGTVIEDDFNHSRVDFIQQFMPYA
jgi:hypothetical protein